MKSITADLILQDSEIIFKKIDFSQLDGKSILITGASGLVGHYLVACLKHSFLQGIKISEIILVVKSEPTNCFHSLIKDIPAQLIKGDLTDIDFLSKLPKADFIIHAAGYGQPGKFMDNQIKTLSLNTITTLKVLEKLNEGGKFLFLSTSELYSGLTNPPYREDQIGTTNTDHFRSCYIEGKRCGEAIVNAFRAKGINAKSARLSLAYGPGTRTDDARVINEFIKKALIEQRIELKDSGLSMRTYLYITDAVEIIFNILFNGKEGVYNLGGESRTSIINLANNIGTLIGIPVLSPSSENKGLVGAPDDVYLDMTRVEKEFGKTKYISIQEGLEKTIEWQRHLYKENL